MNGPIAASYFSALFFGNQENMTHAANTRTRTATPRKNGCSAVGFSKDCGGIEQP